MFVSKIKAIVLTTVLAMAAGVTNFRPLCL